MLGLLKAGLVVVLVDPGMDRATFLSCVQRAAPQAMVGIPLVHLLALLRPSPFASIKKRWLAGWPWAPGASEKLRKKSSDSFAYEPVAADTTAAVVFTTGSTGTPKGVVYSQGNYEAQLKMLRRSFDIRHGDVTLTGFVPFAILCICMGNTAIIPNVDTARPGSIEPRGVLDLIKRYRPKYGLGSPAFWERIGDHCVRTGERLGLRRILLFGAEVQVSILQNLRAALPDSGEIHTPYGSTEAQPLTTISDRDLLDSSLLDQRSQRGICIGAPLDGVEMRVIGITDTPLSPEEMTEIAHGGIGEVVVRGPAVTARYFQNEENDRLHKIGAPPDFWHRMGDCGSFDDNGRLWLVGRKTQRVVTADGTLFPLPIEAQVNRHPAVRRSALVGIGERGTQRPVIVVELNDPARAQPDIEAVQAEILKDLAGTSATIMIKGVLVHPSLPVDYRHNAKIQREALARWAAKLVQ